MAGDFGELDKEAASGALTAKKPRTDAGEERPYLRAECVRSRGVESVRRPHGVEALLEVLEDRGFMTEYASSREERRDVAANRYLQILVG